MDSVRVAAERMALGQHVVFPGFVSESELAVLYQSCKALVFPSLYEGFGMPLLEAMAFDKPVVCSDVTSLPEIAGDAALLFDPRKPDALARAIDRILGEDDLVAELVKRGRQRLAQFGTGERLAKTYLNIFRELVERDDRHFANALHGVYPDGWVGSRMLVTYEPSSEPGALEVLLHAAGWIPSKGITVSVYDLASSRWDHHVVPRGDRLLLRNELAASGGVVEFHFTPVIAPKSLSMNDDTRELSCLCEVARLVGRDNNVDLQHLSGAGLPHA
jgi:hypothetical protein